MTLIKKGERILRKPLKRVFLLMLATIFFLSATAFAVPPVMFNVTIYDGNNIVTVLTAQRDPAQILVNEGFTVSEAYGDSVDYSGFTGANGSEIIITRGVEVTIKVFDGSNYTVHTSGTVESALATAEFTFPEGTALNYSMDTALTEGMVIEVYDIYSITVVADGITSVHTVSAGSVMDAVKATGISVGADDFTQPDGNSVPVDGLVITLHRVTFTERTEIEDAPYDVIETVIEDRFVDERYVTKEGILGSKSVVYRDCYIDGEFVGSEVMSEEIITEPSAEEVEIGAKERPVQQYPTRVPVGTPISELSVPDDVKIGADGVPLNYTKVLNFKATAYSLPGLPTSTGVPAQNGYIAVDPKEIPYGTEMYIVSADGRYVYGYCIAADTGGFIYSVDKTVDLHMSTEAQCYDWGRRDIIIYIV